MKMESDKETIAYHFPFAKYKNGGQWAVAGGQQKFVGFKVSHLTDH
jgi:hypothetical protein